MRPAEIPQWLELPTEPLRVTYSRLVSGLNDRQDPVTWRTMSIDMRAIGGSKDPERQPATLDFKDAEKLVQELTRGTYLESITPEIMYSLGYGKPSERQQSLDTLIVSARHRPEWLTWALADRLHKDGQNIAVINPVGHYLDQEPRILGPREFFRDIDTAVFLTSTQYIHGGSVSVLVETLGLLRNQEFSKNIKNVEVIIPMMAGIRGHKEGQAHEIGYEVLQAGTIPKRLSLIAKDIQEDLGEFAPKITFRTVDIHNLEMPKDAFLEKGYELDSIDPMRNFAYAVKREIEEQSLHGIPLRLVAVDKGAVERTQNLAAELLLMGANGYSHIDIVEIKKVRTSAGIVDSAHIDRVVRMSFKNGTINKQSIDINDILNTESFIRVTSDDMLDSGRSAKKDDELLDSVMPNAVFKISVATHPVVSEGLRSALDNTGSHVIILGNTLSNQELYNDSRVRIVNVAPSIADALRSN